MLLTSMIIIQALLWSWVMTYLAYNLIDEKADRVFNGILPGVLLTPILIICVFRFFGVYLVFPIEIDNDYTLYVFYTFIPSLVLIVSSGVMTSVCNIMRESLRRWGKSSFVLSARSHGFSNKTALMPLVLSRSYWNGWSSCFPWFLCELTVIEFLFNAPGIGTQLWTSMKEWDMSAIQYNCGILFIIYCLFSVIFQYQQLKLSKCLNGYI